MLYVNPGIDVLGGAERSLTALIEASAAHGVQSRVVVFGPGSLQEWCRSRGVPIEVLGVPPSGGIRFRSLPSRVAWGVGAIIRLWTKSQELRRIARSGKVDLIHSNGHQAHLLVRLGRLHHHAPVVASVRDPAIGLLDRLVVKFSTRAASLILPNSDFVKHSFGFRKRTFVVDNPVIEPACRSKSTARKRFDVSIDGFVIASISHLHPWKGQLDILHAASMIEGPVVILLAGGTLYGTDSEAYAEVLKKTAYDAALDMRIVGPVDDVSWVLAAADVLVHSSNRPEGFGRAIIEAALAGTPLIASRIGAPAEYLERARAGLLYTPGDPQGLAEALIRLRRDAALRQRLAADARTWAKGRFTPERHAAIVAACYRGVVLSAPGGRCA